MGDSRRRVRSGLSVGVAGWLSDGAQAAMTTWTENEIREHFARLGVWRRAGVRAPHKPLLSMYALTRVLDEAAPRLVPFAQAEPAINALIARYGPPVSKNNAHYPFWRLQRDGIWEVPERQAVLDVGLTTGGDARIGVLRQAHGGFPAPLHAALRARPWLVIGLINQLLDAHFPSSLRAEILADLGLPGSPNHAAMLAQQVERAYRFATGDPSIGRPRDPMFREKLLRGWKGRCAMCGFEVRFRDRPFGVEGAHVMWHAAGGPDTPDNGMLLCVMHHRAFDLGMLGLEADRRIKVSPALADGGHGERHFGRLHGEQLSEPEGIRPPAERYIAWHEKQVYRSAS